MIREAKSASDGGPQPARAGDSVAEVIALYQRDVDRTLLRAQLAKTPEQRFRDLMQMQMAVEEMRRAGREAGRSR